MNKLMEAVEIRRKNQRLTVRKISYLLNISTGYYIKLRNGERRITETVEPNIQQYLKGYYDNIEIPKYARDSENIAYRKGYNDAIRDMNEFINLRIPKKELKKNEK
ncbi:XRE family transcriptional regulator [Staphylococcus ureilyticus]|uniref:XRE family transcriptional regulator n=1 Tax=Staphylococcus ureilyticus TaxID=94138 RepID=UPI003218E999